MIAPPPIRVMVVDDSAVVRGIWARLVDAEPDLRVVASAWHGRAALDVLERKPVDVVLLDVEMPEMDGLSALPLILERHPRVSVIMASSLTARGAEITVRALSLGAADYVTKPMASGSGPGMEAVGRELVRKIRALAARRPIDPATPAAPRAPAVRPSWTPSATPADTPARIVGITSSTGGPNALTTVLSALPAAFSTPIVIVQHMPALFTAMLAERVGRVSGRICVEATDGQRLEEGHMYVAPGERHLEVRRRPTGATLHLTDAPPENFCRPSADPLFRSLAAGYGAELLAVVLTGMGHDGLEGARAIHAAGGRVVVQDEATSVVWGMPGAVARAGLAHSVLPLGEIAGHIERQARIRR